MRRVLNVGCGNKAIPMPAVYSDWDRVTLDIDPNTGADLICDARKMDEVLDPETFDAVYASHMVEHFYRHELSSVLRGFRHVLKHNGYVHIQVPNLKVLFERMVAEGKDIEDVMYVSPAGPIKAVDMIYGLGVFVEVAGEPMTHKNGFTPKSLGTALFANGFPHVFIGTKELDIGAFAFKDRPSAQQVKELNLVYQEQPNVAEIAA